MRYTWIDDYLLAKRGVTKDHKKEWNWIRYQIGGKLFAAVCLNEEDEPYYITLKLEPEEGDFLRMQYEDWLLYTSDAADDLTRRLCVCARGRLGGGGVL